MSRLVLLTLVIGLLAAQLVHALPEDRLQAIEITADRAERNERAGFTLYSGNVVLIQGSLRIEADRLTIYHDREQADRIVAVGEPARLQQKPAIDKELVVATANQIVYQRSREVVLLEQDASIEQEGAIVSGESIRYFMAEQRVQADATPDDENARVQVFIPAEIIEEAQSDDPAGTPEQVTDPDRTVPAEDGEPGQTSERGVTGREADTRDADAQSA